MPNSRLIDGQFAVGDPCWYDLSTPDTARASDFYAQLFGWTFKSAGDALGDEAGDYLLATVGQRTVAALGPLTSRSTRPHGWWVHFAAPDLRSMIKQVNELGGQADEPIEVAGQGLLGLARDPAGAGFGLWNPRTLRSPASIDTPGAVHWVELLTNEATRVAPFYEELFDVEAVTVGGKQGEAPGNNLDLQRTELGQPRMVAGIQGAAAGSAEAGRHTGDPGWRIYFLVDNMATAKQRVTGGGGSVLADLQDASSREVAIVSDPDGAVFGLVQQGPGSRG